MFIHNPQTQKSTIMDNQSDCDYGFFCDLEQEQFNVYPKHTIAFNSKYLSPIKEESINDIVDESIINVYFNNMKNAFLDSFTYKSIVIYLIISFSSVYVTNKLFYKGHT